MVCIGLRKAASLIELLTALSIVGLLVALLLPAIASSRESACRVRCQNNLHQLGIGLHHYVAQHGVLPFLLGSSQITPGGIATQYKAHSAFNYLLPYLEQDHVYNSLNFDPPFGAKFAENATAIRARIELFLCPSDPAGFDTLNDWGPTSYRLCYGSEPDFNQGAGLGVFQGFQSRRLAGITDGLSHTAMGSEKARGTRSTRYDSWSSIALLQVQTASLRTSDLIDACSHLPDPPNTFYSHTGNSWAMGNAFHTCYSHGSGPNSPIPDCGYSFITGAPGLQSARSYHSGIVHVVMADGSTRAF